MSYKFPVYRPHFTGKERENVLNCIDSTWISSKGKFINEFEEGFAEFVGVKHAFAVSNGTVALHLALEALGVGRGDEVIVPTLTYIASANSVRYTGAEVVFAESESKYWQLDPEDVERRITSRTKAIMPVHLYGHACEMDRLQKIADRHGVALVEDCAEALGTYFGGQHAGNFGKIGTFSFFGNKTITTGEGGMVVTNDDKLAHMISRLKGQGLASNREYWHDIIGYNYRMTNICAAIGCAQLDAATDILAKKKEIAQNYRNGIEGLPVYVQDVRPGTEHSYWMVTFLVDSENDRDPLRALLRSNGVETRPMFPPIHQMPMYCRSGQEFPVADKLARCGFNVPSYPDLSPEDVDSICAIVRSYFQAYPGRK